MVDMAVHLRRAGHEVWMHFDAGASAQSRQFNRFGVLEERVAEEGRVFFGSPTATCRRAAIQALGSTDLAVMVHRHGYEDDLVEALGAVPRKLVYVPGINPHHLSGRAQSLDARNDRLLPIERYLCNSRFSLETHLARDYPGLERERLTWLHPPMVTEPYRRSQWLDYPPRLQAKGFAIGVFGRLIPSKQPFLALDIFRRLLGEHKVSAQLYFLGDGPLAWRIWLSALKRGLLGRVTRLGMQARPQAVLTQLDVLLHTCHVESLSRALREGMLMGCPVVAFRGGGNVELLGPELGEWLFDDQQAAAAHLSRLAADAHLRKAVGMGARSRILEMECGAFQRLREIVEVAP